MKNFLFALIAGCIPVLATINAANAQGVNNIVSNEQYKRNIKIDNSVFPAETTVAAIDENTINTKAIKDFRKSYKNVYGENWQKITDGFTAQFLSNDALHVIYYDKKGRWFGSLKGYNEDKLNKDIRDIVKRKYYDFAITYVQEIETNATNGIPTYIVHLENKNNEKIVRVSDGEMDVYQEFIKQN